MIGIRRKVTRLLKPLAHVEKALLYPELSKLSQNPSASGFACSKKPLFIKRLHHQVKDNAYGPRVWGHFCDRIPGTAKKESRHLQRVPDVLKATAD